MFDYYKLLKYLLEGLAVAIAALIVLGNTRGIILIALTASAVFAILDHLSPVISDGAHRGTGFGIGWNLVH